MFVNSVLQGFCRAGNRSCWKSRSPQIFYKFQTHSLMLPAGSEKSQEGRTATGGSDLGQREISIRLGRTTGAVGLCSKDLSTTQGSQVGRWPSRGHLQGKQQQNGPTNGTLRPGITAEKPMWTGNGGCFPNTLATHKRRISAESVGQATPIIAEFSTSPSGWA